MSDPMSRERIAELREFFKWEHLRKEYILYEERPGNELLDEVERLQAELERLRAITSTAMGVGDGSGRLFVYGDYDSIKAAQRLILRDR